MSLDANRATALAFLRHASKGEVEALRPMLAPGARHHNAHFPAGMDSLLSAMQEAARRKPRQELRVVHALADGDLVAVHSHVVPEPGRPGLAVVHLFRFAKGKVIELWDLGQPVPDPMPNSDGMF